MTDFSTAGPGRGPQYGGTGATGGPGAGPGARPGASPGGPATPPPRSPPPGSGPTPPPPGSGGPPESPLTKALLEMTKVYGAAAQTGVSPQVTDAITQALLAILGAGPSIAAFENLMSINAANGMMYYNAVDHQQKTNLLGMAMTAKCVRYMLDPPTYEGFAETVNPQGDPASRG